MAETVTAAEALDFYIGLHRKLLEKEEDDWGKRTRHLVLEGLRRVVAPVEERPTVNYNEGGHYHPDKVAFLLGEAAAGLVEAEGGLEIAKRLHEEALRVPGLGGKERAMLVAHAASIVDADAASRAAAATPDFLPEGTLNPLHPQAPPVNAPEPVAAA